MSPGSSPEPDRFFTVQDARKIVEHFSPETPISDDKIRRYCREGKIVGEQVDKRWVMTLGALFQAGLVPLQALDHYGEALDIPDSVPEDWITPLAPHEPGPLERMLAADAAAQAAADASGQSDPDAEPDGETNIAAPSPDEPERQAESEPALADASHDEDDADLAPAGLTSTDAGRVDRGGETGPSSMRPVRGGAGRRRRVLAVAIPAVLALGAVGAVATSGDRSSPAQAQPSAATVDAAAQQRARDQQVALRTTMTVAAKHGDYRTAIASATDLSDTQAATQYRGAAAATLVARARAAAERGDLDRARGLVHQSRRYTVSSGADQVSQRVDDIERARKARAAKRKRQAARRAAARRAAATRSAAAPSPRSTPAPTTRESTPANPTPDPTPNPAPSAGGSSGGSGGSSGGSGSSSDKPVDPGIF